MHKPFVALLARPVQFDINPAYRLYGEANKTRDLCFAALLATNAARDPELYRRLERIHSRMQARVSRRLAAYRQTTYIPRAFPVYVGKAADFGQEVQA